MQVKNWHNLIRQRLPWEHRCNPTAESMRHFFDQERREARAWRNLTAVIAVLFGVSGEPTLSFPICVFSLVFAVAGRRVRIPGGAIDEYVRTATERGQARSVDTTRA